MAPDIHLHAGLSFTAVDALLSTLQRGAHVHWHVTLPDETTPHLAALTRRLLGVKAIHTLDLRFLSPEMILGSAPMIKQSMNPTAEYEDACAWYELCQAIRTNRIHIHRLDLCFPTNAPEHVTQRIVKIFDALIFNHTVDELLLARDDMFTVKLDNVLTHALIHMLQTRQAALSMDLFHVWLAEWQNRELSLSTMPCLFRGCLSLSRVPPAWLHPDEPICDLLAVDLSLPSIEAAKLAVIAFLQRHRITNMSCNTHHCAQWFTTKWLTGNLERLTRLTLRQGVARDAMYALTTDQMSMAPNLCTWMFDQPVALFNLAECPKLLPHLHTIRFAFCDSCATISKLLRARPQLTHVFLDMTQEQHLSDVEDRILWWIRILGESTVCALTVIWTTSSSPLSKQNIARLVYGILSHPLNSIRHIRVPHVVIEFLPRMHTWLPKHVLSFTFYWHNRRLHQLHGVPMLTAKAMQTIQQLVQACPHVVSISPLPDATSRQLMLARQTAFVVRRDAWQRACVVIASIRSLQRHPFDTSILSLLPDLRRMMGGARARPWEHELMDTDYTGVQACRLPEEWDDLTQPNWSWTCPVDDDDAWWSARPTFDVSQCYDAAFVRNQM